MSGDQIWLQSSVYGLEDQSVTAQGTDDPQAGAALCSLASSATAQCHPRLEACCLHTVSQVALCWIRGNILTRFGSPLSKTMARRSVTLFHQVAGSIVRVMKILLTFPPVVPLLLKSRSVLCSRKDQNGCVSELQGTADLIISFECLVETKHSDSNVTNGLTVS